MNKTVLITLSLTFQSVIVCASDLIKFEDSTPAMASDVNHNFTELENTTNDLSSRVTDLEGGDGTSASYSWYVGATKLGSRPSNILVPELFITSTGYYGTVDPVISHGLIVYSDSTCTGTKYLTQFHWYTLAGEPPFITKSEVRAVGVKSSYYGLFMHNSSTTGVLDDPENVYYVQTSHPYACIRRSNSFTDNEYPYIEVVPLDATTTGWQWEVDENLYGDKVLVAD